MKAAVDGRSADSLCVNNLLFDATVLPLFFSEEFPSALSSSHTPEQTQHEDCYVAARSMWVRKNGIQLTG